MLIRCFGRIFAVLVMFSLAVPAMALAADDVVANVGGIAITKQQLGWRFQTILPMSGSYHGGVSAEKVAEVREQALQELIEEALKARYAIAEELAVDNAAVEGKYQETKKKYRTEEEFNQALAGKAAQYRASLYRQLLAKKAEEVAVDSRVVVDEEEIRQTYDKDKHRYLRPKQFQASHILVRVDPASNKEERAKLEEKAEDLAEKARSGEDFYDLAYYNSDDRTKYVGGKLPPFHEGQTAPEFEQALLKMKAGETSDVVKTMYGYHIIKLDEVNEARQLSYDEMKSTIRGNIEKERRDALYEEWMEKLRSEYPAERFDN